ncbi:ribonuclease H-like domain-containing protein [Verrucomicrobiota bacterium]
MPEQPKKKRSDLRAQLDRLGYDGKQRRKREFSADEIRKAAKGKPSQRSGAASGAVPLPDTSPPEKQILYRRDLPRRTSRPRATRRPAGPVTKLEEVVQGGEMLQGPGKSFVVSTPVARIDDAQDVSPRFRDLIGSNESALCGRIARVCDPTDISHKDVIFMDVESTGLGNSPLFLIGIMVWEGDGFETRQFFARDYAEESAVIRLFLEACGHKKLLVTFNGKSFDFPYIRTRAAAAGIPFGVDPHHMDMLHVCRRIWRRRLPDCKLQTLETFVCNRARHGDIPGSEIPDAYHEYVRTKDAWQMVDVLKHNRLDLVTMADLMNRLPPAGD